jgi:hypothetical protein
MPGDKDRDGLDLRSATGIEINHAMSRGVFAALSEHRRAGRSVVVWENNQVVHLSPERIDAPGAPDAEAGERSSSGIKSSSTR